MAKLKLAVIGPYADDVMFGGYSGVNSKAVSILAGIRAAAGPNIAVKHTDGVWITGADQTGGRDISAGSPRAVRILTKPLGLGQRERIWIAARGFGLCPSGYDGHAVPCGCGQKRGNRGGRTRSDWLPFDALGARMQGRAVSVTLEYALDPVRERDFRLDFDASRSTS